MNFTDFLYNVFILKSYEAEACEKRQKQRKSQSCTFWTQALTDFGLRQRRERGEFRSERTLSLKAGRWWNLSHDWADEGEIGQQKTTKTVNEIHGATSEFH